MRCILVGNGPSAISAKNGSVIDQFDIVVRFNTFHIDGYEGFVGTKTDIWAVNMGYAHGHLKWRRPEPQPRTIVYVHFTPLYTFPEHTYDAISKLPLGPNAEMCPLWVAKAADQFYDGRIWASTGLMAIHQFMPCTITGFDSFSADRHHYGDDQVPGNLHHSPKLEAEFIHRHALSKDLTFL